MPRNQVARPTERGASLTEYALLTSLVVVISIVAIDNVRQSAGDYLSTTGDDISEPRDRITDINHDLSQPPAWLPER